MHCYCEVLLTKGAEIVMRKIETVLMYILVLGGNILGIFCIMYNLPYSIRVVAAFFCFSGAAILLHLLRCPACGKFALELGTLHSDKIRCRKCGAQLDK